MKKKKKNVMIFVVSKAEMPGSLRAVVGALNYTSKLERQNIIKKANSQNKTRLKIKVISQKDPL